MTYALSMVGLSKTYGRRRAIDDCTVDLPAGKVIALLGANGAGKSTFLALAAGLARPCAGEISVFGEPVRGRIHPHVAYLSQHRPLYGRFTIADMVRTAAKMNARWSSERVAAVIDGLDRSARVDTLSPGQHAQLALALCLGRLPRLLLLDEPLAGLDPFARDEMLRLVLADVAERELTVVVSSHLLGDLRDACDHVVLLERGRVRLHGDIEELLAEHHDVVGPAGTPPPGGVAVHVRTAGRQQRVLLRGAVELPSGWEAREPELDSLVMDYLREGREQAG